MMDSQLEIGARAGRVRKALGLSQVDLCKRLGFNPPTWNNFETGRRVLRYYMIVAFCDEFGVTMDWIFRGDPSGLKFGLAQKMFGQQFEYSEKSDQPTQSLGKSTELTQQEVAFIRLYRGMTNQQKKRVHNQFSSSPQFVIEANVDKKIG